MQSLEKLGGYLAKHRPDLWDEVQELDLAGLIARLNKETGLAITPAEFMQDGCEKIGAALVAKEFSQNAPEAAKAAMGADWLKQTFPGVRVAQTH